MLDNSGEMLLTDINENDVSPAGDTVAAIIASASPPDRDYRCRRRRGGRLRGRWRGRYQWQLAVFDDVGSNWLNFGVVSNTAAVLLEPTALVRFVPTANYSGTAGDISIPCLGSDQRRQRRHRGRRE